MGRRQRRSKRPSAASSKSQQPDRPSLFLDASLGRRVVADALRSAGAKVITHDEMFRPGTNDEVWLKETGVRGWIVLTKDRRIRHREIEKRTLLRFGAKAFILTGKNLSGAQMAEAFVKALPRIYAIASQSRRGVIARVTPGGEVALLERPGLDY